MSNSEATRRAVSNTPSPNTSIANHAETSPQNLSRRDFIGKIGFKHAAGMLGALMGLDRACDVLTPEKRSAEAAARALAEKPLKKNASSPDAREGGRSEGS